MVTGKGGGQVFAIDDLMRLQRFLVLGSDGGTYYTKPRQHTAENIAALLRLLESGRGSEAVKLITEVSICGRAPKQTPTMVALAVCARLGDATTKAAAYQALPKICRTPTHLFEFLVQAELVSQTAPVSGTGWGRAHRRAVAGWYNDRNPTSLAEAVTKYQNRMGWSHRDVLRLCHAVPAGVAQAAIFTYVVKGLAAAESGAEPLMGTSSASGELSAVLDYLRAVEEAKSLDADDAGQARMVELIGKAQLRREHVPSQLLSSVPVWTALLDGMPLTALTRNLAKLSAIGLLTDGSTAASEVVRRLTDEQALRRARVHPMAILFAHRTYAAGRGEKGKLQWQPCSEVVQALETAFQLAFSTLEPTGKRFCLALDVSGSMGVGINGGGYGATLSCHEASAAMALVTLETEPVCETMCFSHTFDTLPLHKGMGLSAAMAVTQNLPFGGTDCSLPMQWALREQKAFDVFVVYTDSETYAGSVHPCEALRQYRAASGIGDARLIVVGMASNGFSIADPADAGMLDVVGFDAATPEVMANFAAGRV